MGILADRRQLDGLFAHRGPVVLMRDADRAGVSRAVLQRMTMRGEIERIAKSAFASTDTLEAATPWERFRLRCIAFARSSQEGTFLTGAAAAAIHGLPMVSDPPELPVALRDGSAHIGHSLSPYGSVRHGYLPLGHRTERSGVPVVSLAYCVIDVARHFGPRDGLLAADKALHLGVDRENLADLTRRMEHYPGMRTAVWVVEHADGRAESPLETLGRLAFLSAGLPAPLSNVWVPSGDRWYRVDHLLPASGVILEADGAVKYNDRPDAGDLVAQDRERERALRALAFGLDRYTWSIAAHRPAELLRRAHQAERSRRGMPLPTCWQLESPYA